MIKYLITSFLALSLFQFSHAQMKTIDIPNVRSGDDIKMDRMSNGGYVAAYLANGTTSVAFYDQDFKALKKIDLHDEKGLAGHFVFTSDNDMLCIGFPQSTAEGAQTDFTFYVLKTSGDQVAQKTFHSISMKALEMRGNNIFMVTYSKKDNSITCHFLNTQLNITNEKTITLDKKNYFDRVNAAFVNDDEILMAYSATTILSGGNITPNVQVYGYKAKDGAQFINKNHNMQEGDYYINYFEKTPNGKYVVIGGYLYSSMMNGETSNSGIFKISVNPADDKLSYTSKSLAELLPSASGRSGLQLWYGGIYGTNTNLGADYVMSCKEGYLFIVHSSNHRAMIITDSSLKPIDHVDLRQHEDDGGDWVYEDVVCTSKSAQVPSFNFLTNTRDGTPVVFSSTLDLKDPEFREPLKLNGENKNLKFKWTNDNTVASDKHYDLKNCNPSLVPSDPSHVVLIDDSNREVGGARIYVFDVK